MIMNYTKNYLVILFSITATFYLWLQLNISLSGDLNFYSALYSIISEYLAIGSTNTVINSSQDVILCAD